MPNAFTLRWKLDQPFVLPDEPGDIHALVTIEPNPTVLASADQTVLPAHLIVVVDVSGSMDYLMRHDPNAQNVGEVLTEGQKSQSVHSDVPSRREVACAVVEKLASRLGHDDLLSVVAFDDKAHVLATCIAPAVPDQVKATVEKLARVGGGGTSMGRGLAAVRTQLAQMLDPQHTRKLILLTDGEDQEPQLALEEAAALGREYNVPIVALGTGECKVAFLTQLAKTNLAGSFNHIQHESDAEQLFQQVVAGQKNVQATNVTLRLWVSPELQLREVYRTRPEILFVGDVPPGADNQVELRLEQMERGKAYEFLFRCTLPKRQANQRFRIAKASLVYDLPGMGRQQETVEANIIVEYTADVERSQERSGDVRRVLARAEVQRQVLFLQGKIDSIRRGGATERDRAMVASLLGALIAKFEEFGEQATANQYRQLQQEFARRGTIGQELLNRTLAASSRAESALVAQDIDF
ncbi:MAG: VWA domain-containing protein [Gemmataceae bacterium]|nr:VWA domain-containing protein [Gemmataceae bacterium]